MADAQIVFDGSKIIASPSKEEVAAAIENEGAFVWFDIDRNHAHELEHLAERYNLHPLAVESARLHGERPQLSLFDDEMMFVEFYGIEAKGDGFETQEISIFLGKDYVVTVRENELPKLNVMEERAREAIRHGHKPTPQKFLYVILDQLVDRYFEVVDGIGDKIAELETGIVEEHTSHPIRHVHELRKGLLALERLLRPERDVILKLTRRDMTAIHDELVIYFEDVYDHMMRMLDMIDSYRDEMATLYDVQFTMSSNRLNQTMRTMTASSIILMATTLIAGIYGMNFRHMPELDWLLGYPISIGVMIAVAVIMYGWFHRRHWL